MLPAVRGLNHVVYYVCTIVETFHLMVSWATNTYIHVFTESLLSSLEHNCTFPGCGKVLILDGNMKNQRAVCFAKDAGFIQFDGLPGQIKTGCPATPAYKRRFCDKHQPQACTLLKSDDVDEELGILPGPAVRSSRPNRHVGEPVAEMILAKKTKRKLSGKFCNLVCSLTALVRVYLSQPQVLWLGQPDCYSTWEPAISLPQGLVQKFEEGNISAASGETKSLYGHVSTTLTVTPLTSSTSPAKRMRTERPCSEDVEG